MWEDQLWKEVFLKDCELFQDNKVNYDRDFVYFSLMDETEPVKIEKALSDS